MRTCAQDAGDSESLLAESCREDLIQQAACDPTSYRCAACGWVVPRDRRRAHEQYWCGATDADDSDGD